MRPSVIGAACCALARHNTGAAAWPSWMSERTGVDVEEFRYTYLKEDFKSWNSSQRNNQKIQIQIVPTRVLKVQS